MQYNYLGKTGIKVSKLCFGALTIGPLQANLSVEKGAKVIKHALEKGVNFIDTAELYETYPYIKKAVKGIQKEVIIATKSYAYSADLMAVSLEKARQQLERDVIDIFLLHEQESILTIKGHWEAVEYLIKAKSKGKVKSIGLSTHTIKGVEAALDIPELEVIHPIVNYKGLGILDGNISQMLKLLQKAKDKGKGIYGMKPIGGGNLLRDVQNALNWAFTRPELASIAVGMQTLEEVNFNAALANGEKPDLLEWQKISNKQRILHIEDYCAGCGQCLKKCSHKALRLEAGQAKVDKNKCLLCGYCGAVCPNFAIKII